jgi:hypothetical protein
VLRLKVSAVSCVPLVEDVWRRHTNITPGVMLVLSLHTLPHCGIRIQNTYSTVVEGLPLTSLLLVSRNLELMAEITSANKFYRFLETIKDVY